VSERLAIFVFVALTSGMLFLAAAAGESTAQPTRPSWRVPAGDAARGAALAQPCLACHAASAAITDPPAPKLRRQRRSYFFFALLDYRDGRRMSEIMAPLAAGVSDQDARDLAAYLAGDMLDRPPPARRDMAGYTRTVRECILCHGETGIGEYEGIPVLTGQEPAYLEAALAAYRDGRRTDPTMTAVVRNIAPEDDRALADYYAAHAWLEHGP
jgi:cytochrome c553